MRSLLLYFALSMTLLAGEAPKKYDQPTGLEVVPTLETKLSDKKSSVWCATLQLAWDEANALMKNKIAMEDQDPEVEILNNNPYPEKCINPKYYYAGAGYVADGFHEKMLKELKKKFGNQNFEQYFPKPSPVSNFLACSYLDATIPFRLKFNNFESKRPFIGADAKVYKSKWFGFSREKALNFGKSGSIISWQNEDNFSLSLNSRIKSEQIILFMGPKPDNFKNAINQLAKKIEINKTAKGYEKMLLDIGASDTLMIPHISLNTSTNFDQFCKRTVTTPSFHGHYIDSCQQSIKLQLDNSGARVKSSSTFVEYGFRGPRKYIFDKPFMVLLWRKGAPLPYLALWVNDGSVLSN